MAQTFLKRVKLVIELYTWLCHMTSKVVVRKFKLIFLLHPAGSQPFPKTQGAAHPSAPVTQQIFYLYKRLLYLQDLEIQRAHRHIYPPQRLADIHKPTRNTNILIRDVNSKGTAKNTAIKTFPFTQRHPKALPDCSK